MKSSALNLLIGAVVICVCAGVAMAASSPVRDSSHASMNYADWVKRYAWTNLAGSPDFKDPAPIKLILTEIEGDEHEGEPSEKLISSVIVSGSKLLEDGTVWYFSYSDRGTKGGGGGKPLPVEELKRLDGLLAHLPGDRSWLPPAGRRMLLQMRAGDTIVTRVYDRANLPDVVLEIMRLSRCVISPWFQRFEPHSEINARGYESRGFLRVCPDGQKILFTKDNGPMQLWDITTHEFLADVRIPQDFWNSAAFSPDGSLLVLGGGSCACLDTKTWKILHHFREERTNGGFYTLTAPRFTADGRYLFLECNRPSLKIFDLKNWQPVDRLPGIPEDAVQCTPSPGGKLALVRLKSGAIVLWNVARQSAIATLDRDQYLSDVMFSPDGSLVAAATAEKSEFLAH